MANKRETMPMQEMKKLAAQSAQKGADARKSGNNKAAKRHDQDAKWFINQYGEYRNK
jgi:hypothetical protein